MKTIPYKGGPFDGCQAADPGPGRVVQITVINTAVSKDDNLPAKPRRGLYRREGDAMAWEALPR